MTTVVEYRIEYNKHGQPHPAYTFSERMRDLKAAQERAVYLVVRGIAPANAIRIYKITIELVHERLGSMPD